VYECMLVDILQLSGVRGVPCGMQTGMWGLVVCRLTWGGTSHYNHTAYRAALTGAWFCVHPCLPNVLKG
jgi:hypothetical protein